MGVVIQELDEHGNPKPFDVKRKKGDKSHIFALVIGINDYQGSISQLGGCVNDVNLVSNYLRNHPHFGTGAPKDLEPIKSNESVNKTEDYDFLHLRTLTNSEATYENIIKAFDEHLVHNKKATGDATFWLHFSGHGTERFTAEQFKNPSGGFPAIEPNGKDQCLVAYNPGGVQEGVFVADKELAALLENINTNVVSTSEKPHIVVTLDCCHSGSGTRDFAETPGLKTRGLTRDDGITANKKHRPLASYYGGYADENDPEKLAKTSIPTTRHLLISACDSSEKAGDLDSGGIFTSSLIDVLSEESAAENDVNYAKLFTQVRSRANGKRESQTPQFEPIGGFNPFTAFLEGWKLGDNDSEVFEIEGEWYIRSGAIHGIPMDEDGEQKEPTMVRISKARGHEFVGDVEILSVGMEDSWLDVPDEMLEIMSQADENGNKEPFVGEVISLPTDPQYVWLHGDGSAKSEEVIQNLKNKWTSTEDGQAGNLSQFNIIHVDKNDTGENPEIELLVTENKIIIKEVIASPFPGIPIDAGSDYIRTTKRYLSIIARWRRLLNLENQKSSLKDEFELEVMTLDHDQWLAADKPGRTGSKKERIAELMSAMNSSKEDEIKIYGSSKTGFLTKRNTRGLVDKDCVYFAMRVRSKTPDLHFYLYDFKLNCAIELVKDLSIENESGDKWATMHNFVRLNISKSTNEEKHIYKLFVTRSKITKEALTQGGIPLQKASEEVEFASVKDEWYCTTKTITLVRQKNQPIDAEKSIEVIDGVTVNPHSNITAKVSIVSADPRGRSLDPASKLTNFGKVGGMKMMGFGSSRSLGKDSVIELTDLDTGGADLEENPLEIMLNQPLNGDFILPIAHDGQNYRVIGDAEEVDGKTKVNIRRLDLPANDETKDRSLFKALKMAFIRIAPQKYPFLKKLITDTEPNQLSWVEYLSDGTVKRHEDEVATKSKVKDANNILLLLHGIIGDTKEIAENLTHITYKDGKSMKEHFDLVLTYDYENLHTPIVGEKGTAAKLKAALETVGLSGDGDKKVTILCHSMGGLVSRWYIEKLGGDQVVEHLIMAGTPNNGSGFGNVEKGRKILITLLDLAANFLPNLVPYGGYVLKQALKVLKTPAEILQTLGDMAPSSDLIKELNNPEEPKKPNTRYSVVAGDVRNYKSDAEGFGKFMENFEIGLGNLINKQDANDIAVDQDRILNPDVWNIRDQEVTMVKVDCHHLNYFTTEEGRKALSNLG